MCTHVQGCVTVCRRVLTRAHCCQRLPARGTVLVTTVSPMVTPCIFWTQVSLASRPFTALSPAFSGPYGPRSLACLLSLVRPARLEDHRVHRTQGPL